MANTLIRATDFPMPTFYIPPLSTPLYWRDEQTGVLRAAIMAYLNHQVEPAKYPKLDPEELKLVIAYLRYVIDAPCWGLSGGFKAELAQLREFAARMATVEEVEMWIHDCLEIGIDPL